MAPPSCPHHPPCLSHSVPCSGSCVADSGRVKLYGMDVVPDNLAPILSGENRGVGVCPYETFVWRDLTVQEHMLVMGMVYGAWITCNPVRVELYLQLQLLAMVVPCLAREHLASLAWNLAPRVLILHTRPLQQRLRIMSVRCLATEHLMSRARSLHTCLQLYDGYSASCDPSARVEGLRADDGRDRSLLRGVRSNTIHDSLLFARARPHSAPLPLRSFRLLPSISPYHVSLAGSCPSPLSLLVDDTVRPGGSPCSNRHVSGYLGPAPGLLCRSVRVQAGCGPA